MVSRFFHPLESLGLLPVPRGTLQHHQSFQLVRERWPKRWPNQHFEYRREYCQFYNVKRGFRPRCHRQFSTQSADRSGPEAHFLRLRGEVVPTKNSIRAGRTVLKPLL